MVLFKSGQRVRGDLRYRYVSVLCLIISSAQIKNGHQILTIANSFAFCFYSMETVPVCCTAQVPLDVFMALLHSEPR
jgi:hypothetical protein